MDMVRFSQRRVWRVSLAGGMSVQVHDHRSVVAGPFALAFVAVDLGPGDTSRESGAAEREVDSEEQSGKSDSR